MTRNGTTDPLVGHVLDDRYEILQRLARGGMATVYRAQDLRLGRIVAVKVMHDDLDEAQGTDFARKFDREARAAAALTDSHVVGVFDQGIDDGRPYIVMEFIEGCTLRNLITREAPFDPERALSLIEPIAAALAAAHESGLVHRDVKPENVLIGNKGQIKVADFGLARAASAKTITVAKGNVIGTVSYLPPEIVAQTHADARSDIYSTGIVLYELLTGEKPYTGENLQVAYAHVNKSVPAPSQTLRRNGHAPVPDYVDALVLACTRRDPDRRPADGHELLTKVRRARAAVASGVTNDESLSAVMYPAGWREGRNWSSGDARSGATRIDTEPIRLSARIRGRDRLTASAVPGSSRTRAGATAAPAATRVRADQEPARPPSNGWHPVGAPSRPSAPVSPVDYSDHLSQTGPHQLPRHQRSPMPRSQRTPLFPEIVNDPVHRRRRGIVATLLVLILATVIGVSSWWVTSGRFIETPDMVGMSQDAAISAAQQAGLTVSFEQAFSDDVEAGVVISTDPTAGTKIERKSQIDAVVSAGPQTYAMPNVAGLTQEAATQALIDAHLAVGAVTQEYSDTVAAGDVISASAEAGTQVVHDTAIDLVVSMGPSPIKVKDYTGKSADEAKSALERAGFTVTTEEQPSSEVEVGHVISQDPASGQLQAGSEVHLVVSSGAEEVAVPDVRARTADDARSILEAAGFEVEEKYVDEDASVRLNRVQKTDPVRNTKLAKGSTVTIYII
ncbi:Serine/threonine-protein kinase PrkC [Propionibacterium australiense]|uniref:non-specific serine/threonine protein kinase n=1 Tax=Propionibacterium australiense TaxID=119981 RepID=A0A383S5L1_9ACTN|nr:non-specific serine/threonine protein kinase [Propionibacterium australiense]VEH91590.1 Serine/threonine-protein kinase PrkC [Propionibacterium australiense]